MSIDRSVSKRSPASECSGAGVAAYARALLEEAGAPVAGIEAPARGVHAAWAESGAMWLSGLADGPPHVAPAPLAGAADAALLALRRLAGSSWRGEAIDGASLLGERAAHLALRRGGRLAPGRSCRLLRARDGWLAANLARPADRELLEAWLESSALEPEQGERARDTALATETDAVPEWLWQRVESLLSRRSASAWVERARLMGLPVADVPREISGANGRIASIERIAGHGDPAARRAHPPRVLDLSGLWAGPLAAHLLQRAGAEVVKCESLERPDGARSGAAAFYDVLNGGKPSVALSFASEAGRRLLAGLIDRADIVIESARPRALRALGIDAERWIQAAPGRTWLSLTGYGRSDPEGGWVAFGDDAAAASGLAFASAHANGLDEPTFCGDAIADPLLGMHAAVFALANHQRGASALLSLSLRGVVASLLALAHGPMFAGAFEAPALEAARTLTARAPRARLADAPAPALGAHTGAVLEAWGVRA